MHHNLMHDIFSYVVPGLTGSQLRGTVDSEWEDCSSLPENFLLWFGLGTLYCPTALE